MNIKINKPLLESQQIQQSNPSQEINTDLEEIVMKNKSKQFNFDCGVVMAHIKVPLNSRFGLKWHFDNSKSIESFIESIRSFINVTGNDLTENDITMLTKQYTKQVSKP